MNPSGQVCWQNVEACNPLCAARCLEDGWSEEGLGWWLFQGGEVLREVILCCCEREVSRAIVSPPVHPILQG